MLGYTLSYSSFCDEYFIPTEMFFCFVSYTNILTYVNLFYNVVADEQIKNAF